MALRIPPSHPYPVPLHPKLSALHCLAALSPFNSSSSFVCFYINLVCMLTRYITGLPKSTSVIGTVPQTPRSLGNTTKRSDELNLVGLLPSSDVTLVLDHSTAALVLKSVTV